MEIKGALAHFPRVRALIVGDVMLDRYTHGQVSRISPEAPVPVLERKKDTFVLGGAANVAHNIASLGARAYLVGVVGNDAEAATFRDLLKKAKIEDKHLFVDDSRPTSLKQRIVTGGAHQLLRIDRETTEPLPEDLRKKFLDHVKKLLPEVDIVLLSDYAKGVFTKEIAREILSAARAAGKSVIADIKPKHKTWFYGVDVIEPNLQEAKEMSGLEDVHEIGKKLAAEFSSDVLLTQGGDGITIFGKNGMLEHIQGKRVQVYDVSGAGDTVLAAVALSLASGVELIDAALIANHAGAIVVQKAGTATLSLEELSSELGFDQYIEKAQVVPKVWGSEKWLENNERYCSKLLSLNKGYQCSLHYHKIKDEMFVVLKGHIRFELGDEVLHLRPGHYVRVPVGTPHRFRGLENSEFIEISTHHDENDSYRIEESRKVEEYEED